MKRYCSLLGLVFALAMAGLTASEVWARGAPHVVILNSYHREYAWTNEQSDAMLRVLVAAEPTAIVDVVYMDWKRFPTPETLNDNYALLRNRRHGQSVDLVLTTDDAALIFALKHRAELFSGAPIVFSGVFEASAQEYMAGEGDVTGVYEAVDPEGSIRAALMLDPGFRHVYVVHDSSETSLALEREIRNVVAGLGVSLDVRALTNLAFEDLRRELSSLPEKSFILLASYARDVSGLVMQPERFAELMSQSANAPIFTMYDHMLGMGVVGGSLLSGELQGEAAATLGVSILRGASASSLPPVLRKTVFFGFEYDQLIRFGLPSERLPEGSRVVGEPFSFFERYRYLVLAVTLAFVLLLALVVLLGLTVQRKRTVETALRDSEKKLRNIFDRAPLGILIYDHTGRVLDCNDTMQHIFHVPRSTYMSLNLFDIIPSGALREALEEALVHGEAYTECLHTSVLTGVSAYIHTRSTRIGDGVFMGIIEDVTERKRAEDALRESEERRALAVRGANDGLWDWDLRRDRVYFSDRWKAIIGFAPGEIVDDPQEWRSRVHPDDLERVMAVNMRCIRGEIPSFEVEYRLRHKDGGYRWVLGRAAALKDERGEVIRVAGAHTDITERRRMMELMLQTEKMMSVGGLAAGMAHEINNPLSGIMQGVQVLLGRLRLDTPKSQEAAREAGIDADRLSAFVKARGIEELLESIREAGLRASRIVTNMLEFSRRSDAVKTMLDVNELLEKTLELCATDYSMKKKYDFKHIQIEREFQADLPKVPGSLVEIQQVFLNVLGNAAQAMAENSAQAGEPRIILRTARDGDMVRVEIADNGPGMDENIRRKAFEPFFTTKAAGEGTGLGLSVSYFIVTKNHGGTFEVESAPGQGACFIVRLPLASPPEWAARCKGPCSTV